MKIIINKFINETKICYIMSCLLRLYLYNGLKRKNMKNKVRIAFYRKGSNVVNSIV